jgi:hypothetical protein
VGKEGDLRMRHVPRNAFEKYCHEETKSQSLIKDKKIRTFFFDLALVEKSSVFDCVSMGISR